MHPDSLSLLRKLSVVTGFAIALFVAYELRSILAVLAFSVFLATTFSPLVDALEKRRIPAGASIVAIYFVAFVLVGAVLATTLPIFATELVALFSKVSDLAGELSVRYASGGVGALGLPAFLVPLASLVDASSILDAVRDNAGSIARSVGTFLSALGIKGAGVFASVGTGVADIVLTLLFTFFLTLERREIRAFAHRAMGERASAYVASKEAAIVKTLSAWVRGQALLALAIFSLTLVGLYALEWVFGIRLESRPSLALIAGITEFVPYLGPLLALLPALALALGMGPEATVAVLVLYLVIQQLENNVLVPWLMSKSLELSPFYVLVMTMAGATLWGIVGILVALPVAGIVRIFAMDVVPTPELPLKNHALSRPKKR